MSVKAQTLVAAAVDLGLIGAEAASALALKARRERLELVDLMCLDGRFLPAALYRALAERCGIPYLDPGEVAPDEAALRKLPPSLMQRHGLAAVRHNGEPRLLISDPDDQGGLEMARRLLGGLPPLALSEPEAVAAFVEHWLSRQGTAESEGAPSGDYVALLDAIFKRAYLARASDIHIEPARAATRVRLRVDGRLRDYPRLLIPAEATGITTRVKVLAGLDIAESREPQDGGLRHQVAGGAPFDVRVATAPTRFGERVTLRLLGAEPERLTLSNLGMGAESLAGFREIIRRPHGIILITGPTGSGKSTTLYAALRELVNSEINLLTVEDPIEQVLEGVSQVQVGGKLGFVDVMRAFLRHDPDVIMVGEVRDLDTAAVAFKAALTGHLVFSTLHTNSAVAAITRLADLGVERFLIASTVAAAIAQRLVRRLCPRCRRQRAPEARQRALLGDDIETLWEAVGCYACQGSGFRGRIGLFETLWIGEDMQPPIASGASESAILSRAEGFESLWQDGLHKLSEGLTTLDEVLRVARPPQRAGGT